MTQNKLKTITDWTLSDPRNMESILMVTKGEAGIFVFLGNPRHEYPGSRIDAPIADTIFERGKS